MVAPTMYTFTELDRLRLWRSSGIPLGHPTFELNKRYGPELKVLCLLSFKKVSRIIYN